MIRIWWIRSKSVFEEKEEHRLVEKRRRVKKSRFALGSVSFIP